MAESVAIVGYGAIGEVLAAGLLEGGGPRLSAVLVRPRQVEEARASLPAGVAVVTALGDLLACRPGLVVESAGQGAVREHGTEVLAAGVDLMVVSTGALADDAVLNALQGAAAGTGARILIPAGAIAGLDGLGSLKAAGLVSVTYTSTKPPLAWRGTPTEETLDLAGLRERTVFFEGSAREAALRYPKNANLAATVALAGLGLDRTEVRLVADPAASGNTGTIEASSEIGDMTVVMAGRASANPKTSASTAFSLLHAVRSRSATLVI
ncbi:aspartate dehydrogenase [Enterovirga sp. CN4-39]|uniref:aspartate dehydrogenase n=1 Tax=Enterovirga sp. CN4-39 TaxID=3400910 RepID=UPI003BFBBB1C